MAAALWLALAVYEPVNPPNFLPLYQQAAERAGTAGAYTDLALFLQRLGDRAGAELYLLRAVAMEPDAERLVHLSELRREQEIPLLAQALGLAGAGARAGILSRLGAAQQRSGDLAGAEKSYRGALELLGPADPKAAVALNDLGLLLEKKDDFKTSEALYRRALAIQGKALGPRHPETGVTLNNLAGALGAQGKLVLAEPLLRRALSILQESLGPSHALTKACASNLADLVAAKSSAPRP